ncbi:MAG: S41 family peptidase [Sedimentisphaerales bacterium]|nr:S41 family peptidase [Sedimentisphaerales bacterium]
MKKQVAIIIVLFISIGFCSASAQDITATERSEIIDNVVDQLANQYVDPNLGRKAAQAIAQKKDKKTYDALETRATLISALITDMLEATGDKQLKLKNPSGAGTDWIHPALTFKIADGTKLDDKLKKSILEMISYGLPSQVQEGNIGFMGVLEFYSPEIAPKVYQVIDKAMQSFQGCTAMILDLRQCIRGGDPEVMMYLASYLLEAEASQPLYTSFNRENEKVAEFRTRTDIPGKRMPNIPVYILMSSETFSTGEMFAYGLQKIGRAKIIGETSAGAAHGTDTIGIGRDIVLVLPVSRLAHVKTKTDWQGTGVVPEISVKADDALNAAKDAIQKAKSNK